MNFRNMQCTSAKSQGLGELGELGAPSTCTFILGVRQRGLGVLATLGAPRPSH